MRKALIIMTVGFLMMASPLLADEFSADMVTVTMGRNITGKIYFKDARTHRTEIMGMISITKHPYVYQLFDKTQKYVEMDIREEAKKNPMADVSSVKEWISKNNMKKAGQETIEGYACTIYEGDVEINERAGSVPMKIWYNKKLEYPLKYAITLQAPMGQLSAYLANIQTGKQAASLFEVPPGYTQAADIQEAMGMPKFAMPQGGSQMSGNQAPSPEQMEQMMKQMQQMMQNRAQQ